MMTLEEMEYQLKLTRDYNDTLIEEISLMDGLLDWQDEIDDKEEVTDKDCEIYNRIIDIMEQARIDKQCYRILRNEDIV